MYTNDHVAALTFDDGPHPEYTPRLLEVLGTHNAHATFFMIGSVAQQFPQVVGEVAQAGHAIGNHSWDHPSFPLITGRERRAQIRACARAIAPYGQRLFRPPYGHQSIMSQLDALLLGYQVVTWNLLAHDWLDHDPEWMLNLILQKIQPGSVILFHDGLPQALEVQYRNREPTIQVVKLLLEKLSSHYRFVTIPDLLIHGRPHRQIWFQKPNMPFLQRLKLKKTKTSGTFQMKELSAFLKK